MQFIVTRLRLAPQATDKLADGFLHFCSQIRRDFPDSDDEEFRYLLACTVYLRTERDPAEARRRLIRCMAVCAALTMTSNVERDAYFLDP
jgi:hypothetical protein